MWFAYYLLLTTWLATVVSNKVSDEVVLLNPSDIEVVEASQFALEKLVELSDSGIYETIKVESIRNPMKRTGLYHDVFEFTWVLSSPHLNAKKEESTHKVVVLSPFGNKHKRHFSIDEFPSMDKTKVKEYRARKKLQLKKERERFFDEIEKNYLDTQGELINKLNGDKDFMESTIKAYSTRALRALLGKIETSSDVYGTINSVINERLDALERSEVGKELIDDF